MSIQHLSWRHLSISGISQLLLSRFWPNFKSRFLESSWTDSNCHGDICQGNICPGNICTYREYLSCYWPDFYQTLKVDSLDHLELILTVMATFVQATFVLRHLSISGISPLLLTWFWPKFKSRFLRPSLTDANCHGNFCPGKNISWWHLSISGIFIHINFDQTFLALIFLDHHFFGPKNCLYQNYLDQKSKNHFQPPLSDQKKNVVQIKWLKKIFGQEKFLVLKNLWSKNFFDSKDFLSKENLRKKYLSKKVCLSKKIILQKKCKKKILVKKTFWPKKFLT